MPRKLDDIVYITLPPGMARTINGFKVDPARQIPVQMPDGKKEIDGSYEITEEMIVSGMLRVICMQPDNPNTPYYRGFVLAVEPDAVNQLNLAAIAQAKKGNADFAEELFLTVNHLSPQSATYINLATCYLERAKADSSKGTAYDMYTQKALDTLMEGLGQFPKDPGLLSEIGYFHAAQGNADAARTYFERYLAAAPEGEEKKKIAKVLASLNKKIANDTRLLHAYDEIQMSKEEDALRDLEVYIKDNPKIWNAYFLKGWALRRLDRFEEAKEAFLRCLSLGERDGDIYNELSLCEYAAGSRDLAKTYLETAVDLDDSNITYLSNLAYMDMKEKNYAEARRLLDRARALDPDDPLTSQLMKDYAKETGDTLGPTPVTEEVADDEALKEAVKKRDDEETRKAYAAHEHAHEDGCGGEDGEEHLHFVGDEDENEEAHEEES